MAVATCVRTSQNPRKLSCGAKRRNLVSGFYVLIQSATDINTALYAFVKSREIKVECQECPTHEVFFGASEPVVIQI